MSIFSYLIVHVLHSFFLNIWNSVNISDLTIMIMIYQGEVDFDFQLKI